MTDTKLPFTSNLVENEDGSYRFSYYYQVAYTTPGGQIQLNNDSHLSDPAHVLLGSLKDGTEIYANLLTDTEKAYGLRSGSLTTDLFWAMFDLHELGHVLRGLKTDDGNSALSKANTQAVVDACFKDLK